MNLVLSSLFNLRHYRSAHRRIFVLVDGATNVEPSEYVRCLRPWSSWITVLGILAAERRAIVELLVSPVLREADIVVLVTTDMTLIQIGRAACARLQKVCVDATLAPEGSRELALFQEVLHHDYELGGRNDWTGADSQFGAPVLRMLSTVHCRLAFPQYAEPHLDRLWQAGCGQPLQVLDIGCGAVSRLRWASLNGFMTVTGVDPLLDMYAIVRERHGLNVLPAIRCAREVSVGAEGMAARLVPGSFDVAYCANALDHTEDPAAVVGAVANALRPGGLFVCDVYTREGSRENWWQLHQFDMYVNDADEFVAESRDGVVRPMFPEGSGLALREIVARNATTALVAERVAV